MESNYIKDIEHIFCTFLKMDLKVAINVCGATKYAFSVGCGQI